MKTLKEALPEIQSAFDLDIQIADDDVNRLEIYTSANWGADNLKEYIQQEDFLYTYDINDSLLRVQLSYDVSGYDYWMKNMQETNYAHIDVIVKKELLSVRDIDHIVLRILEAENAIWDNLNTSFIFNEDSL